MPSNSGGFIPQELIDCIVERSKRKKEAEKQQQDDDGFDEETRKIWESMSGIGLSDEVIEAGSLGLNQYIVAADPPRKRTAEDEATLKAMDEWFDDGGNALATSRFDVDDDDGELAE